MSLLCPDAVKAHRNERIWLILGAILGDPGVTFARDRNKVSTKARRRRRRRPLFPAGGGKFCHLGCKMAIFLTILRSSS